MFILDRYILKKFLSTYVFVVAILVSIVLIITFSERNESFIRNEVPSIEILFYFLNYAPYLANLITPLTVFIAAVFVTSKMAGHTEIIAILAGGVSFPRLMRPYLIGAIIIAIVSFLLTGWVIPNANKSRIAFEQKYFDKTFNFNERDIHFKVSPTSYVYMASYNSFKDEGHRFTLEEIVDQKILYKFSARQIRWDSTRAGWKAIDWNLREFGEFSEDYEYQNVQDTLLKLNMTPSDFGNNKHLEQTLTLNELNDYIDNLELKGADNIPIYRIEKYVRYMSPFSALVLTFIGLIVSSRKTRGGVGFQIAMGFLIAFIFIILFVASKSMAETGSMNPKLAVWLPNIIFSFVAMAMYKIVPK